MIGSQVLHDWGVNLRSVRVDALQVDGLEMHDPDEAGSELFGNTAVQFPAAATESVLSPAALPCIVNQSASAHFHPFAVTDGADNDDDAAAVPRVHTTASFGFCRDVVTDVRDVPSAVHPMASPQRTLNLSGDDALLRKYTSSFGEELARSRGPPEQYGPAIRGAVRLIVAIVGPCLVPVFGLALIMAFTLTTTAKGNLLFALIVHGNVEVQLQCDEWEQLVTCQAEAQLSPLAQITALPSVFRYKILEALIWLLEAAAIIMGTRLLFPYDWDRRISVMVVGLQVLSYGCCLIHVYGILQMDLDNWGLIWCAVPIAVGSICCLVINSTCPAEYKLIRNTKEVLWNIFGIFLAVFPLGLNWLLGLLTIHSVKAAPALVMTLGLRLLVGLYTVLVQTVVQHLPQVPKQAWVTFLLCMHIVCQTSVRRHAVTQSSLTSVLFWSLGMVVIELLTVVVPALLYRRKILGYRGQQQEEDARAFELRAVAEMIILIVSEVVGIFQVTMHSLVLDPVLYQLGADPDAPLRLVDVLVSFGIQISLEMVTDVLVVTIVTLLLSYRVAATVDTLRGVQGFNRIVACAVTVTCLTMLSVNWNMVHKICLTCPPHPDCPRNCAARWSKVLTRVQNGTSLSRPLHVRHWEIRELSKRTWDE